MRTLWRSGHGPGTGRVDEVAEMMAVAEDWEADVLDSLRRRAGITWECYEGDFTGAPHWTNHRDDAACGECGRPRPEVLAP